jgi:hypothetical protein
MARKEVEVLPKFRRKFVLIILRPPVQITDASQNECWPYCCSGRRVACNFYYSAAYVSCVLSGMQARAVGQEAEGCEFSQF